jgi:hypothetical protein
LSDRTLAQQPTNGQAAVNPLVRVLQSKGILTADEVAQLSQASSANDADQRLAKLLLMKGIISQADYDQTVGTPGMMNASGAAASSRSLVAGVYRVPIKNGANSETMQAKAVSQVAPAAAPAVIPAVAPIRVLPIDAPKREGIAPDFKIGNNIRLRPYGFFKATAIYDSSSPYGNDFPLPGFIGDTNGPDKISEFHVKARSLRFGTNFEWMDIAPNVVVTGKFEVDFEGNFTRVNNRNISSIRSSQPSIRLGYGRIDWHAMDHTTVNFLAGQDWTLFASSTLPNLFESTQVGAFGFGNIFERQPQIRFGVNHNFGGFSIEPDFAVVLPAFGDLPSNVADQLGEGERQGVDSGRPEVQARLVAQFQLDKAPGVAPAQIIFSGMQGERSAVVLASAVPTPAAATGLPANFFKAAFPTGTRLTTDRAGYTVEVQLPTRFATLTAKYFRGSDLRYYFAGQLFAEFNDAAGFATFANTNGTSIDGSSTLVFGATGATCSSANVGGCTPVVAPQRAPRSQGGFLNLGLPLSRWANANPSGRNAGWTLYLHYGYDAAFAHDVRRLGGGRVKGDLFSGQLQYKLNNWVTFAAEESLYRTRALPLTATGQFPLFQGRPTREWKDIRTEMGPIFTF